MDNCINQRTIHTTRVKLIFCSDFNLCTMNAVNHRNQFQWMKYLSTNCDDSEFFFIRYTGGFSWGLRDTGALSSWIRPLLYSNCQELLNYQIKEMPSCLNSYWKPIFIAVFSALTEIEKILSLLSSLKEFDSLRNDFRKDSICRSFAKVKRSLEAVGNGVKDEDAAAAGDDDIKCSGRQWSNLI